MRRNLLLLSILLAAFVVAGCGGPPPDTSVPAPPQAAAFEPGDNPKINQLVADWKSAVPAAMRDQQIKPETIEERVYQSSASLQEIASFYKQTLTGRGWHEVPRMPGLQDGVFLAGYEIGGNTTFVVNAVDASLFGGSGVVVYTVKGHK
jgi:hypothetical protein